MGDAPKPFTETGVNSIASYNWVDLTQAVGYIDFYAGNIQDSTGSVYSLSNTIIPTKSVNLSTPEDTSLSTDFVTKINKRIISEGNASVYFTFAAQSIYASSETFNTSTQVSLYHLRGSTYTQLGSTISDTVTSLGQVKLFIKQQICSIAIPRTTFSIGDSLVLRINLVCGASASNSSYGSLYFDATGATVITADSGFSQSSVLGIKLPVKTDL